MLFYICILLYKEIEGPQNRLCPLCQKICLLVLRFTQFCYIGKGCLGYIAHIFVKIFSSGNLNIILMLGILLEEIIIPKDLKYP